MTYVDERVVELRFDNKQFEQETAKSMSTLDKLKEKLQFKNAQSGAEQLQKAVANININPIVQGIDTLETKMSALGIAGKRVIENLVDWSMSGIHKLEQKLQGPINQIINGGKSRAQNIEQAKFQLEGLGVAWEDIEEDISYGVQDTAYGLDAAAKVASQLVASQVELGDDMKHALLGISGVAAMTNSTYEDIGRVYTNVAGNGRLMGEQLLQLSSRGINAAATLAKALNTTEADVREMVSKGKISFQMFSDAMFEAFGEHAKSANKTFQGALSNTKAALSRLGADVAAQGFNSIRDILNDIIPKLKEFKNKMKPVEESIIKMTEAIGKLIQAVVQSIDIERIVNKISPFIKTAADYLRDFADAYRLVFEDKSKISHSNDAAFFAEQRGLEALKTQTEDVTTAMEHLYDITDKQKEMAKGVWAGEYGNGMDRVKALGENYDMVQAYVEKMIELGWDEAKMEEFLSKQTEKHTEEVQDMSTAYEKKKFIEKILEALGNLKHVLKNVATSAKNILKVMFKSFGDAFSGETVTDGIVTFTGHLADISDKLLITEKRAEKLRPVFDFLAKVIKLVGKGIIAMARGFSTAIDYLGKFIKKAKNNKILKAIFDAAKNAAYAVVDAIEALYHKIQENGIWDKFVGVLQVIAEFLGERIVDAFNIVASVAGAVGEGTVDIFTKIVDKFKEIFDKAKEGHPWLQKIADFFKEDVLSGSWLEKLKDLIKDLFGDGKDIFKIAFDKGSQFINGLVSGLKDLSFGDVERITKIVSAIAVVWSTVKWLGSMARMNNAVAGMTGTLNTLLESINTTIKKYGKSADAAAFESFAKSVAIIVGTLISLGIAFAALEKLGFDAYKIMDKATQIVLAVTLLMGVLSIIREAMKKVDSGDKYNILGSVKTPTLALTLFAIGYMLQAIARAIITIYNIKREGSFDPTKYKEAVSFVVITLGILAVLSAIAIKYSKAIAGFEGIALMILSVGIIIGMVGKAVKKLMKAIDGYEGGVVAGAFGIVEGFLVTILGFASLISYLTGKFPQKGLSNNPFKGVIGMFLGLAALIRLGLVPLLDALISANKQGSHGIDAIDDFEHIVTGLMIFIGLLGVVMGALSHTYNIGSKNAAGGAKAFQSTVTGGGLFYGLALTIAALAAMFAAIGSAISSMDGIDNKQLNKFKEMTEHILIIVGILAVLAGVGSAVAGPAVIAGLAALAAVILSVAATMLAAGYGFKAFAEGLKIFVESLPSMLDALLNFFKKVSENKQELLAGVAETTFVLKMAVVAMLVGASEAAIIAVPTMVHNLMVALVAAINQLAYDIVNTGPELVDATNKLTAAIAYLWVYASDNAFNWVKDGLKKKFVDLLDYVIPGKLSPKEGWGDEFGTTTTSTAAYDPEYYKDLAIKDSNTIVTNYTAQLEEEKAKAARENKGAANELLELETYLDLPSLTTSNSKTLNKVAKTFGLDSSAFDFSGILANAQNGFGEGFTLTTQSLLDSINSGDLSKVSEEAGFNVNLDILSEMVEAVKEGGPEVLNGYLDLYGNLDQISLDQANDMSTYAEGGWTNYEKAVEEKKETVCQASREVMDAVVEELKRYYDEWYAVGRSMPEGLANGALDKIAEKKAVNNVADIVTIMINEAKKVSDSHSPSKVFEEIGSFFTMGLAEGVLSLGYLAEEATEEVGQRAIDSMRAIIDRIYNTTMDDMDTSPRITPVLDLSEVESGISTMGGMFNGNNSFGLAFGARNGFNENLAARNLAMDVQNDYDGTNVVDAINGLRQDITGLQEAMTNMGFYVDGRQMAKAIANPMNDELNDISLRTGRGVS